MGYPHGLLSWADVAVPDMGQGAEFYSGLFGWEAVPSGPGDSMPYTMFMLDGQPIAGMGPLGPEATEAGRPPVWSSYITVDDIDATATKAKELGAVLLMEPMQITNAGSMFVAIDPVGAAISFWQPGGHAGAGVFNVPGAMSWNELACRDVEAAKAFYTELLGWGIDFQQHGDLTYTVVKVGDRVNGGIYDMTGMLPDEVPAHWFVWFTVDGTEAALERVLTLGGSLLREPWDSPFGRMAVVADPQGPAFGLITMEKE
jgi:predicted enzyme related to lactoylglutathione lyase